MQEKMNKYYRFCDTITTISNAKIVIGLCNGGGIRRATSKAIKDYLKQYISPNAPEYEPYLDKLTKMSDEEFQKSFTPFFEARDKAVKRVEKRWDIEINESSFVDNW